MGEVADIIGGGTPSTAVEQYWGDEVNWYTPSEVNTSVTLTGSKRKISYKGLENSSTVLLPAERTILFTSRASVGDTALIHADSTTNQGFQSLVVKRSVDKYFMYSMGPMLKVRALKLAAGSTFLEVSGKQVASIQIKMPELGEQKTIAGVFRHLDSLLALHQRKQNTSSKTHPPPDSSVSRHQLIQIHKRGLYKLP